MKPLARFILTLFTITACGSVAQSASPPQYPSLTTINEIQQALFNDQFEEALALCSLVIQAEPSSPSGYSLLAGTMMARMTDREEDLYGQQFERLIDTTIILAENRITELPHEQAAWTCLWLGNAYAYQALYESRFGSLYNAMKSGMKAREIFARGVELDSTNKDLLAGLGSYHYWKSAKAGFLRWIGLFKNEKERGQQELREAFASGSLYAESARRAMLWIWLDQKQYDSVVTLAREIWNRYPEGKSVLWPLAEALTKLDRHDEAVTVYLALRTELATDPGNYYNLIECDYALCECYRNLSDDALAGKLAANLDEYDDLISKETRKKQKKKIAWFKRRGR